MVFRPNFFDCDTSQFFLVGHRSHDIAHARLKSGVLGTQENKTQDIK